MTTQQYLLLPYKNEDQFTAQTNTWVNHNHPLLRGFYLHIANESATSKTMRLKLFAMGLLPGAPDFLFLLPMFWFLELKMPDGTLSPKQKALHAKWKSKGIEVYTAYSKQQVVFLLEQKTGGL